MDDKYQQELELYNYLYEETLEDINKMHLYVYKPLYQYSSTWVLRNPNEKDEEFVSWVYGDFTYHIINSYKLFSDPKVFKIVSSEKVSSSIDVSTEELVDGQLNDDRWDNVFYELMKILTTEKDTKNDINIIEPSLTIYDRFKHLAWFLYHKDFDGYDFYINAVKNGQIKNLDHYIEYKGTGTFFNDKDDEILCDIFDIHNMAFLFALDLREAFYNPNINSRFRMCKCCSRFFINKLKRGRRNEYCEHCLLEADTIKSTQNKKYMDNNLIKLRKNTLDWLRNNAVIEDDETERFKYESMFYYCKIKGKTLPDNNYYFTNRFDLAHYDKSIKTDDSYIKWIKNYRKKMEIVIDNRKYGDKNAVDRKKDKQKDR